jgi:acyl transferase domain-containing protein/NAD(P)-dependent dehydrogenase (short-subunit alcohol dehydrogenase family)/3-hydroxymyristoyl/3-hydroxydecanoyl-(acyl carrier protein) dehydratase
MNQDKKPSPVAIVGIGCLFPKAPGLKEYWRLLYNGEDAVKEVPETHWSAADYYSENPKTQDHTYCTRGGYLSAVPFNPAEFGIPPNTLEATDTSQLLGLVATRMALDDAGYGKARDYDRSRVSVMIGATVTQELVISLGSRLGHPKWRKALEDSGIPADKAQEVVERISDSYAPWQESSFPGLLGNVIAGRIANRFDFGGTNTTLDAACASSFTALNLAFMELQTGRSDMVVTGGVDTLNDIFMHMCFAQTGVLSHDGKVKAFSDKADGTVLAEGVGILILKRLEQAEKDKDKIYAVIRSVGSSSDGKSLSIYAPSAKGQARAIKRAYDQAGIDPATVEMVEAHGTGTRGDVVEFDGLVMAFGDENGKKNRCGLGTVKSNIGHAKASAGVAGLIKGILALHHKVLPPFINLGQHDPKINIKESPFYFLTQPRPWLAPKDHPRRCGVTASGFGGSNFHVILEEYAKEKPESSWDGSVEILSFSGHSSEDVLKKLEDFKSSVAMDSPLFECDAFFRYQAYLTRQTFNAEEKARLLLIVTTDERPADVVDKAIEALRAGSGESFEKQTLFFGNGPAVSDNLAFVFPGQGSQYTHMGRDIVNLFGDTREILEKANAVFAQTDPRLSDIMYPLPDHITDPKTAEETLRKTDKAQPAIGAVSLSMDRVLKRFGLKPKAVCGHSFGELTALCSAGWITEDIFLSLAAARGKYMADCGDNAGTMLAVKAPLDELDALIKKSGIPVVLANRNCYDQGVLSGSFEAIGKADALCREKGFRTTKLPVAAAFHSSLVEKAAQPFSREVEKQTIKPTAVPVYANTTGDVYPAKDVKAVKKLLGHQLSNPVNFVANIENLCKSGIRAFVEVGPKPVLTGLIKSMAGTMTTGQDLKVISLDASSGKKSGVLDLAKALCQLAAIGCPVQLSAWEDALSKPEKQGMSIPLTGANHRNPVKPRPKTTFALPVSTATAAPAPPATQAVNPQPLADKTVPMTMKPDDKPVLPESQTPAPVKPQTAAIPASVTPDALQVIAEGLKAMQTIQSQTADAHNRFLAAQAEAGRTLQDIMEKARQMMSGDRTVVLAERPVAVPSTVQSVAVPAPVVPASLAAAQTRPAATPAPRMEAPAPRIPDRPVVAAPPAPMAKPVPAPAAKKPSGDFRKKVEKHMLDVVSELTGYPVDMIGLDMDIEADLGIDSIKRVEIMSTFEERVPDLPSISPEAMAVIKTLGEIVAYVCDASAENAPHDAPVASAPSSSGSSLNRDRLSKAMLDVVSELTGYPVDMIGLDMDIEADLGIDSIKRVEIMSSFEERVPDLPSISPEAMAVIKTLGEILDYVAAGTEAPALAESLPSVQAAAPSVDMGNLTRIMLDVVSELTGYPVDMIGLDMDIEADLGIDSIKRVEIMSAFEERTPDLPSVSPEAMATIKTLGEILAYVGESLKTLPPSATPSAAPAPTAAAPAVDLKKLTDIMLDVVSGLTGYPVDMIGLDMDIEADLGIDSIKRVEIMSAFEERVPDLPSLSPDAMAVLKTLGEIVAHVGGSHATPSFTEIAQPQATAQPALDMDKITRVMKDVVSRLTGYPEDLVALDMDIEADLGIDSIKRVEIMSEFENIVPDLPAFDPDVMVTLKTLQQILDYVASLRQGKAVPQAAKAAAVPVAAEDHEETHEPIDTSVVNRQVVVLEKRPLSKRKPLTLPANRKIYVTDDKNGLSAAIVSELKSRKLAASIIQLDDKTPDAAGLVIVPELKKKGALASLAGFKKKDSDIWDRNHEEILKKAFDLAHRSGLALMESAEKGGAFFATVSRLDGTFGFGGGKLQAPVLGGLSGLAKTADLEWENVSCKALDVDINIKVNSHLARRIVDELLHKGAVEVGFTDSDRFTLHLEKAEAEKGALKLGPKDVVMVSGGAKGVTAAAAIALAKHAKPTIVLLGRSDEPGPEPAWLAPLTGDASIKKGILENLFKDQKVTPAQVEKELKTILGNREITKTLARLKKAGSNAAYFPADVRDLAGVSRVVEEVKAAFGPIKALIHGAGVLEDRFIVDQTLDQFNKVYNTKVNGLENLLRAIPEDDMRYLVLFSSVSARVGNTGQVAYAMANEVLNKVGRAYAEHNKACRVVSINWGPWDGGMVTESLKKEFAKKHVELIPIREGAECMVLEMGAPLTDPMEVVIGGTFPTSMDELAEMKQAAAEAKPLPAPSAHLTLSFKKDVDTGLYPILNSHVIKEKPVVPFALMTEWFGHGALHKNPGFLLHRLDGMRVFKGIKIEGETKSIRLMSGKPVKKKGGVYDLDLEIRNGHPEREVVHSKASAVLVERLPEAPDYTIPPEILGGTYTRNIRDAYEQVLFHGPDLHGIKAVKGCSDRGMVADVASAPPPSAWITDPLRTNWVADPLVIDSAYQMAILWCYEQKGVVSLPSYSASYRQYSREFPHDGMTVVMEVKGLTEHKMTSDFTFLDRKNKVVATITGYEAVMDESLLGSFGKEEGKEKKEAVLFDRKKLLAYAVGNPSEAFGDKYKVFDKDRIIARLPGPPYFFMDSVTKADHKAFDLKPGGWIEAEYLVPKDEWYFRANRSDNMPFCVLLEIALQPCGWLAAYAGSALRNDKQLKFRNLGGKAVLYKEVKRGFGTLTMRTRMSKVSEAAGMIIEDFDLEILHEGELLYKGVTNFGFFTNETMEQQVGIRNPENIVYRPSDDELSRAVRVDFPVEAPVTPDDTATSPFKPATLPSKALLMVDGVECYIKDGGPQGLGYVRGYKNVDVDEWFFKAHFYQDPVCPGSLGIESFIQLMKFAALDRFKDLADTHRIDFVTGDEHQWLYRGQVIPKNKKVEVTALVTSVSEGENPSLTADGYLMVDGLLIYQMKNFSIRMTAIASS